MKSAVQHHDGSGVAPVGYSSSQLMPEKLSFPEGVTTTVLSQEALFGDRGNSVVDRSDALNHPGLVCRVIPWWKRAADIVISLVLMLMLLPLLISIAAWIWWRDGGPVLFHQKRLGLMGKDFVIYKFRTLKRSDTATSEHREFVARLSNDNAVTNKPDLADRTIPGGLLLRSTSLDELPQLWNILRGDMSLIGPRPDVLQWEDYQPWQLRRFEVLPGVTGLWQVSGKNRLTFNEMIEKDIQYVDQRSALLDLSIALRTCLMILSKDNH